MEPTHRRLLDVVLADPDDEAPRRVLADWLDERGDPRGELITLQCELARIPAAEVGRRDAVEARIHQLLAAHGPAWLAACGLHAAEATFEKGFVDVARLADDRVLAAAAQLGAHEPVRSLIVRYLGEPRFLELLRLPLVHLLSNLHADNNELGPDTARALAAARPRRLRRLNLGSNRLGDDGVEALARSPFFAGLRSLDLGSNRLGARGAIALATCKHLADLEQLELERNAITDDGAAALAASPHLTRLTRLNISRDRLRAHGISALAKRFGEAWVS
ncbi:MAG: TIGR02996 domain-containing protein [Deltaproteobacteria bacterium]|nr:TIGR02996 domain-containing protein [Deltaproteobacteria bacterium]MCW5802435.1 TIGR02996 domain-containing protein [Deltaproteobacteria bacterium]